MVMVVSTDRSLILAKLGDRAALDQLLFQRQTLDLAHGVAREDVDVVEIDARKRLEIVLGDHRQLVPIQPILGLDDDVEILGEQSIALVTRRGRWCLRPRPTLTATVSDAWYSPSYGVRVPCRAVDITRSVDVSTGPEFVFQIERVASDA